MYNEGLPSVFHDSGGSVSALYYPRSCSEPTLVKLCDRLAQFCSPSCAIGRDYWPRCARKLRVTSRNIVAPPLTYAYTEITWKRVQKNAENNYHIRKVIVTLMG